MARITIICEQCGNEASFPASQKRQRFCSVECLRTWQRKQKEFCPDCGAKMTHENTYNRSGDGEHYWMDNVCKPCRITRNSAAYLKRRAANGVTLPQIKNKGRRSIASKDIYLRDWHERGTLATWKKYMANNPHYFTAAFNVSGTAANIAKIAAEIF